ncbi:MAG: 30S ribosomal protein S10 [Candidatus Gracilibacteria bacterium]|jgi:small subunit ribosomal protein S10|nr:30S ribosomal protein S10 [Candidatus Gracilibacteria bacterium]
MTASVSQKIRITLRSFDHTVLDEAAKTIIESAERTGALIAGPVPLPVRIKKVTLNKSTFVNKDSREQFEIRTHKRLIDFTETTPQTIDALQSLSLPAGVEVDIKMLS